MISRADEPAPAGYHKLHVDININQTRNKAYRDNKSVLKDAAAAVAALAAVANVTAASSSSTGASGASSGGGSGSSGGGSSGGGSSGGGSGSSGGGSGVGSAKSGSDDPMGDEKDQKKAALALKEKKQRESALYLCHTRDRSLTPITDVKLVFVYKERKAVAPPACSAPAPGAVSSAPAAAAATKPADGKAAAEVKGDAKRAAMEVDDAELDALVEAHELAEARSKLQASATTKSTAKTEVKAPAPVKAPVADAKKPATDGKALPPPSAAVAPPVIPAVQDKGRVLVLLVPHIERGVIPKEVYANIPHGYELIPVNLNQPTKDNESEEETESLYLLFSRSELCGSPVTAIDITTSEPASKAGVEKQKMYPNPFCPYPPPPPPPAADGEKPVKPPAQGPALTLSLSFTGCPIVDLKLVSGTVFCCLFSAFDPVVLIS
jgi:hypothetical protein